MAILKLNKVKFTDTRLLFFFNGHIDKVFVSSKIYLDKRNCEYFIGYLYNDNEVNPLHIMLAKTNPCLKRYAGQIKWMYFLIEDDNVLEKYNTI